MKEPGMIWKCQQFFGGLFCCIIDVSPVMNVTLRPITSQLEFNTINRYKPTVDRGAFYLLSHTSSYTLIPLIFSHYIGATFPE